jgi:hypothetical protein
LPRPSYTCCDRLMLVVSGCLTQTGVPAGSMSPAIVDERLIDVQSVKLAGRVPLTFLITRIRGHRISLIVSTPVTVFRMSTDLYESYFGKLIYLKNAKFSSLQLVQNILFVFCSMLEKSRCIYSTFYNFFCSHLSFEIFSLI